VTDLCIIQASKSGDGTENSSSKPPQAEVRLSTTRSDSDTSLGTNSARPMRRNLSAKKFLLKPSDSLLPTDIIFYLARRLIPLVRKIIYDQDKSLNLFTNMMYYLITPMIRNRSATQNTTLKPQLEMLSAISKLTFSVKVWKKEIWDAFNDTQFFAMGTSASLKWKGILQSLMVTEKDVRMIELLGNLIYPIVSFTISTIV
jgi:hypothetical protein